MVSPQRDKGEVKMKVKQKKKRICDPGICEYCLYICDGDFICDKKAEPVLVVEDWEPTEDFMWCDKHRRAENVNEKSCCCEH